MDRYCLCCGRLLVPRVFPGGQREHPGRFAQRNYCSQSCGRHHARRSLRPNPDRPGTLLVPLTKGQVAIIDAEDAERVGQHPWSLHEAKGKQYAASKINGERVWLHRFIMAPPPDLEVDHINGDGLNCTRANMRLATDKQQSANRRPWRGSASGYRGVSRHENKWSAQARYQGRLHYLGRYTTPEEAARAVDAFWREVGDEFSYLNFPEG